MKEGKLRADVKQRQIKTLNNRIEPDLAPIKNCLWRQVVSNQQSVRGQRSKGLKRCEN